MKRWSNSDEANDVPSLSQALSRAGSNYSNLLSMLRCQIIPWTLKTQSWQATDKLGLASLSHCANNQSVYSSLEKGGWIAVSIT